MSSLFRIKEGVNNFTETEKKISEYILDHREQVLNDSVQTLAEKTKTSPAAIIRFTKKIGYKGFSQLKVELAKEREPEEESDYMEIIREDDEMSVILKKSEYANRQTFKKTYKLIRLDQLEKVISIIKKAKAVYIFGVGASSISALDFVHKLSRIGIKVIFQLDSHLQVTLASQTQPEDVAVVISYSGHTREVNLAQRIAQENGTPTIAVTSLSKSELSKNADYVLNIPNEEKELRLGSIASRYSSLAVLDLIYFGLVKNNIEETKEKLVRTRNYVNELKED